MQTNARAIALVAYGCTGLRRTQWEAHLAVHDEAVSAILDLIDAANAVAGNTPPAGEPGNIDYCDGLRMLIKAVERIGGGV